MLKWECGMVVTLSEAAVTLSEAVVTLSEAKGLFSRLRCFASLSMTPLIPHSPFRIGAVWCLDSGV
jgi:hypothetical protein